MFEAPSKGCLMAATDPIQALFVGSLIVAVLGGIGLATLTWLIVRDYLRGQG
jgi:hypothetical protein